MSCPAFLRSISGQQYLHGYCVFKVSIKPFVISRKNFLFANTPKGATCSAIMFSLIQTAIENGLDPYKYLIWLMKTAKDTDLSQEDTIQTLLPWNAPVECKNRSKE